jgi:hypothetical protein
LGAFVSKAWEHLFPRLGSICSQGWKAFVPKAGKHLFPKLESICSQSWKAFLVQAELKNNIGLNYFKKKCLLFCR